MEPREIHGVKIRRTSSVSTAAMVDRGGAIASPAVSLARAWEAVRPLQCGGTTGAMRDPATRKSDGPRKSLHNGQGRRRRTPQSSTLPPPKRLKQIEEEDLVAAVTGV